MSLADLIPPPVTVATLAADGLLPAEIAAALGLSEGAVLAELGEAWISPAHVSRVEAALLDQAIGGTTWRESPDKLGGVIRLESDRRPDVQAAKAVLAARMPERYGNTEPMRLAPAPLQVTIRVVTAGGQTTGRVIEGEASEPAEDDGPALVGDDRAG